MTEPDWKVYLDKMINSLDFLNRKGRRKALEKGLEMQHILSKICKYGFGINEVKDLAREEYRGAVIRHLLGFFPDSIFHSIFSVEMGLLVMLDQKLQPNERNKIHSDINKSVQPISFTFGRIIDKASAKDVGIVQGNTLRRKMNLIIDKRNTYVHGHNFMSGLILSLKKNLTKEIDAQLDQIEFLVQRRLVRLIVPLHKLLEAYARALKAKKTFIESLPDFSWCGKDKYRSAAEKELEEYVKRLEDMRKGYLQNVSVVHLLRLRSIYKSISSVIYFEDESQKILEESLETLAAIGIF